MWYQIGKYAICKIPRAGSTSLGEALGKNALIADLRDVEPLMTIGFMRHPRERLFSAWSLWRSRRFFEARAGLTHAVEWRDFCHAIAAGLDDVHWTPQTTLFTPARWKRFDQLGAFLEKRGVYIKRLNYSEHSSLLPGELDAGFQSVAGLYAQDLEIYRALDA